MHGACSEHQPEQLKPERTGAPIDDWDQKRASAPAARNSGRYCSSGSRRNGFFWPGVAAGLPCGSKPVLAMVSCDVSGAADASEGARSYRPGRRRAQGGRGQ